METLNTRIIELRDKIGLNQTQFAKKIGVTSQLINMLEAGKTPLTESNIRLICLTFGVNEAWLREGTGEMLNNETLLTEKAKRLHAIFQQLSPRAHELLIEYAEKILSDEAALRGEAETAEKGEKAADNPIHKKKRA
jgi:transcriptional regulator with XRE-family HTH domain